MRKTFGFGPSMSPATPAVIDPNQVHDVSGYDPNAPAAAPTNNVAFSPGLGAQAAQEWAPSFLDKFRYGLSHNDGSMQDAGRALTAQHEGDAFSASDAALLHAAMAGKTPEQQFAMHHDPASYSTDINSNNQFHTAAGGSRVFGFGKDAGTAPQVGVTPGGQGYAQDDQAINATGRIATPQTQDEAVRAANAAEETRQKGVLLPAQMLHLDRMGRAALINVDAHQTDASRPRGKSNVGGGLPQSMPSPRGWK